ncbi:hypothetical protein ACOSP7_029163 [Xanthoceras sorbifolium]
MVSSFKALAQQVFWSPPSVGFKINVDAAIDSSRKCFGVGIVIRDCQGDLIFVAAMFFDLLFGIEAAELTGILLGIRWALSLNLALVVVDFDALNMVRLCAGLSFTCSDLDNIVQDIHFLLEMYSWLSIAFVPRLGNNVAHCVVKWAVWNSSSCCWASSFPDWLLKLVKRETAPGVSCASCGSD